MLKQTLLTMFLICCLLPQTALAARPIQTSQKTIVIDPGHGGADKGLVASSGAMEKNITLQLALKTMEMLEKDYNVLLTRSGDNSPDPEKRVFKANSRQADLFVSIHLNNSQSQAAFFYYFDLPQTLKASQGNRNTDWTTSPLAHQTQSRLAARCFSKIFYKEGNTGPSTIRKAPVNLLEGTTMPAVLIEPFSLSALPGDRNRREAAIKLYARLIAESIEHYLNLEQPSP